LNKQGCKLYSCNPTPITYRTFSVHPGHPAETQKRYDVKLNAAAVSYINLLGNKVSNAVGQPCCEFCSENAP